MLHHSLPNAQHLFPDSLCDFFRTSISNWCFNECVNYSIGYSYDFKLQFSYQYKKSVFNISFSMKIVLDCEMHLQPQLHNCNHLA